MVCKYRTFYQRKYILRKKISFFSKNVIPCPANEVRKGSILSASSHPMLPLAIRTLFHPFEDSKMATLVPSCSTKRSTLVTARRALHRHRRRRDDGLVLGSGSLLQLCGKDHRQGKDNQEDKPSEKAQFAQPRCGEPANGGTRPGRREQRESSDGPPSPLVARSPSPHIAATLYYERLGHRLNLVDNSPDLAMARLVLHLLVRRVDLQGLLVIVDGHGIVVFFIVGITHIVIDRHRLHARVEDLFIKYHCRVVIAPEL